MLGGRPAANFETMLSEGDVSCESVVEERKRMIALCTLNGEDVGKRFVASGFGLTVPDETSRYKDAQADARVAGIGLWQYVHHPLDVAGASHPPPYNPPGPPSRERQSTNRSTPSALAAHSAM